MLISYIPAPIEKTLGCVKHQIMRVFKTKDYCQLKRVKTVYVAVRNFWNNNYIKYKIIGNRNKNLSVKEYINKTEPCLRDIVINLQKSDTQKIQLKLAINFIFSKYVTEERAMQ